MTRLILASRSPARARLLRDAGLDVEVRPSRLDEQTAKRALVPTRPTPKDMARALAVAKAQAVEATPQDWVLGADQTLDRDGKLLEKPGDAAGLRSQLEHLQGRSHHLHAAAALIRNREVIWSGCSSVRVAMRPLTDPEIERYVATEGPNVLDCVGGYRVEGPGVRLLESLEGEYFGVVGLPLLDLLAAMRQLGIAA